MESAPPSESAPPAVRLPSADKARRSLADAGRHLAALPHARIGIVALAAALRLWQLDLRPPHFDEGVNGWFTDQMQRTGCYHYDPTNYHGPLHFYVLFIFKCLLGRNLWALRLPVALIGILTVDWIFRFERYLGRRFCAWAALGLALSPAYVFYHRYAIHETWLAFFMILGMWGLLGLWRDGSRHCLWAAGMGLTGMILTKETYVIHVFCLLAAGVAVLCLEDALPWFWKQFRRRESAEVEPPAVLGPPEPAGAWPVHTQPLVRGPAPQRWRGRDLAAVAAVGLAAIVFFYSGNGFAPQGLSGLVTAFAPWTHKAKVGEGHNKPFYYWFEVLLRNEPWAIVGLAVSLRFVFRPGARGWPLRLLALYALGGLAAYSLIPYKTPWCVLAFAWPFLFLAAAAIDEPPGGARGFDAALAALAGTALMLCAAFLFLAGSSETPDDGPFGAVLAYSENHHLTPWLLLACAAPLQLLAIAWKLETVEGWRRTGRLLASVTGAIVLLYSGWLAVRLNFRHYADDRENYVYVHTFEQVAQITGPLYDLAREDALNYARRGLVLSDSVHPLPWLLGDFSHVGYYGNNKRPPDYRADFLVVSEDRLSEAEKELDGDFFKESFRLRPSLMPVTLYLRASVFSHLMPGREPEFRKETAPAN